MWREELKYLTIDWLFEIRVNLISYYFVSTLSVTSEIKLLLNTLLHLKLVFVWQKWIKVPFRIIQQGKKVTSNIQYIHNEAVCFGCVVMVINLLGAEPKMSEFCTPLWDRKMGIICIYAHAPKLRFLFKTPFFLLFWWFLSLLYAIIFLFITKTTKEVWKKNFIYHILYIKNSKIIY